MPYDAVLLVSFGGPEARQDVLPFLENVLRGRNVPAERMREVAEHYNHFGGKSPINDQNRLLLAALSEALKSGGPDLPIYWGNRNWRPYLADAIRQMERDGIRRALAFVTSAYSSYSGCRQYREDIQCARQVVGEGAPLVDKIRPFYNHPGFLTPIIESVAASLASFPDRNDLLVLFSAHSIPVATARTSRYQEQVKEASRIVAEALGLSDWSVAWQSRSGSPSQPWLEPDLDDVLRRTDAKSVLLVPVGFISDHMEVIYDLDVEARSICEAQGIRMVRAATVGTHPRFIRMIRELILERFEESSDRPALGILGPNPDVCPADCCPAPAQEPRRPTTRIPMP